MIGARILAALVVLALAAGSAAAQSESGAAADLHQRAEAALGRGENDQAVALLQQAIAADPGYWPSLGRMGERMLAAGRPAEAEPLLRKATEINPQHGPCLSRYAQALLTGGRTEEAEAPLKRAADLMPSDAGVLFNLARLYEMSERIEPAIETYRRFLAISTDPKRNTTARLKLARLLSEDLKLEESIAQYQLYLKDVPERHEVRNELAMLMTAASRYPEALAEYEQVFAAGGGNADGLARAGAICILMKDYPRAVGYLERSVQTDPTSMPSRISLGTALAQAGNNARAVEVLSAAAADKPDDERVYFQLAQSLIKLGRNDEARAAMEKHKALHEEIMKKRMSEKPSGHP